MIRLLVVLVVVVPATLWWGLQMLWAVWRDSPDAPCACARGPRKWARLLLRCSGVRVELENAEVIDPDRPQILVANHVSWFDVLALAAFLPGRYLFVAKKELRKVPLFGSAVQACGHIFIDRKDRDKAVESLGEAKKTLEETGPTVIMFPEGTRSATGELQRFKKGAFVLAIQTGIEVVPAAIGGSREVMRRGSLLIRPGTIRVRFGQPLSVEGYDLDMRHQLTREAREALLALQSPEDGTTQGG